MGFFELLSVGTCDLLSLLFDFFGFFCFVLSCYQLTACRVMLLLVVPVLLFMPFLEFLKGQKECSVLHS